MSAASPLGVMANYGGAATSFFSDVRVPAALISGSALAAFFTLVDVDKESQGRIERFVWFLYHGFGLLALMLSLNVVVTATASGNELLLGFRDPMATSVYALLKREYEFEFVLTRWSFFTSIFSFLACVVTRTLLEFKLLRRKDPLLSVFCLSSVGALFFHLVSFVNQRLVCFPNLWVMTLEVIRLYIYRSRHYHPMEMVSVFAAK
jgi:hypothetical protein